MRPLSERGRAEVGRLAEAARDHGLKPDLIWHSGKLRARQTAEAFWRTCNPLAVCAHVRGLRPEDPPPWMRDQLAGDPRSIVVVSHMPYLPALLRLLTGDAADPPAFDFPLHGCVALVAGGEADGNVWKELWRLSNSSR